MSGFAEISVAQSFMTFGEAAFYTNPAGNVTVPVRVISVRPDEIVDVLGGRVHSATAFFEVRASEITPQKGGQITLGGTVYVIQAPPRFIDDLRLVWLLDTCPA